MRGILATTGVVAALFALPARAETPPQGPKVDQPGVLPASPPSPPDAAYDARLRESYDAAKSLQGPFDGGWTITAEGLVDLYELQLADHGESVEGAWRNLREAGGPAGSGVIDSAQKTAAGLALKFDSAVLAIKPNLTGELRRGGQRWSVVMRRKAP